MPVDLSDAIVAHRQGHLDQAAIAYEQALAEDPERHDALYLLGIVALQTGDLERAGSLIDKAIAVRPDTADYHAGRAEVFRALGQLDRAVKGYREAIRLRPDSPEHFCNLGAILVDQGDIAAAIVSFRAALSLKPDFAAAHNNLGNALLSLGRLDEAEACLREAIRLRPNLAAAHANLAGVLERLGDFELASDSLHEALRHDPRHAGALARLATRLRDKLPDAERAAIEHLLAEPDLSADRRATLLFALGGVHDAQREFVRAAALVAEANALQLDEFRRRGRGYEPVAYRAFVDQILATFTLDFFARVRGFGMESSRPIFVVGLPRSGTSLVEQILASHPQVFGAGELSLARETFEALPEVTGRSGSLEECLDHLDLDASHRLAHRYLDSLNALNESSDRVVDKMPENYVYLGLIATLFPHAKIIHCRRDVRDVALSCWLTNFGHVRWSCDPEHIASRVFEYRRVMAHWRETLPIPWFDVDYETIVADLESTTRALLAWCDLDWNPACLEFHTTRRPVQTVSVAQVRTPIYASSIGRWKNYEQSLGPLFVRLD